jgi:NAD(P)-dependent dehydrogenase (short-subunit alcohol dehydrogenase family)
MQIQGNVFIVTGGASGLGAGTARMLSEAGAKVVIADLNEATGQALATELGGQFIRCDVTSEADGQAVVAAARAGSRVSSTAPASPPPTRPSARTARIRWKPSTRPSASTWSAPST